MANSLISEGTATFWRPRGGGAGSMQTDALQIMYADFNVTGESKWQVSLHVIFKSPPNFQDLIWQINKKGN